MKAFSDTFIVAGIRTVTVMAGTCDVLSDFLSLERILFPYWEADCGITSDRPHEAFSDRLPLKRLAHVGSRQ